MPRCHGGRFPHERRPCRPAGGPGRQGVDGPGFHVLAGRNVHFDEPFFRQIAAIGGLIFADVAGDIGKLEGQAQIAGAVERRLITRIDAHQDRHHATHRARDMIAIAQHVRFAAGAPFAGVEGEAFDQVMGVALRNRAFPHDQAEAVEGRIARRFAPKRRAGERAHAGKACRAVRDAAHRAAMILSVRNIVAFAAPGIEQPGPFPGCAVEQPGGECEGFGASGDALAGLDDQGGAVESCHAACGRGGRRAWVHGFGHALPQRPRRVTCPVATQVGRALERVLI